MVTNDKRGKEELDLQLLLNKIGIAIILPATTFSNSRPSLDGWVPVCSTLWPVGTTLCGSRLVYQPEYRGDYDSLLIKYLVLLIERQNRVS